MITPAAKPKRVLHFIESEGVYGAERVILNLSSALSKRKEFEPVVGCIVPNNQSESALYNEAIKMGITALKLPIRNAYAPFDLFKIRKLLKQQHISLVHSHGYKPSVYAAILYLLTGIKAISTCHLWFNPKNGPLKMRVMIRLEKFFYRWFPRIIAVSAPIKDILLAEGIKEKQTAIIKNGVDTPERLLNQDERNTLRESLGIKKDDLCILNSARLSEQKAQWVLIDAANQIKTKIPQVKVLIVGEGPLKGALQTKIDSLALNNEVKLLGFRKDVHELLQIADVFALPSIDEGMPMALLEAAASQRPIVSTSVGDIGKLIQDNSSGLIIPLESPTALADAVFKLHEDSTLGPRLAHNAYKKMESEYSSNAMANQYALIYKELTSL